ncbi:MAG: hypothetical protein E7255_09005 [Lachnospiraceae bacterium]|jgi:hypothetical protein|nr:hypothetical protein [Lachnospiraceae bacterium]
MKALSYLLITQFKNRLLALKKKPALMVLYLFITIMLLFVIVVSIVFDEGTKQPNFADERIVFLILGGVGLLYLGLYVTTGLSTGSTLFTMSDVGLLFVAPVSSKKILFYGILSTIGKSILASIFILYQIGNLKSSFGYGVKEIMALFFIYIVAIIFGQLLSIATYIFSNGNSGRKKMVQTILYLGAAVLLFYLVVSQRSQQIGFMEAVFQMVDSKWFGFVPMGGWMVLFFKGVIRGAVFDILISIALFAVVTVLFIVFLTSGTADYYEDVLLSTEITQQKLLASKEGRRYQQNRKKKVKVSGNEQEIKGKGATALIYKNILELKRKSRFFYIDSYTFVACIGAGIAGYNLKGKVAGAYGVLAVLLYLQFFLTMFGSLRFELTKPYIFLIPEKSIKKVVAASVASLIKPCIDGAAIFAVFAITGGCDPFTAIFLALAYSACGILYVGLTILYQRFLGAQPNMIAKAFVGIGLLLIVMAPAIVSSVIVSFLLPESLLFLSTLPFTICCLVFTVLIFLACGNMLEKIECASK